MYGFTWNLGGFWSSRAQIVQEERKSSYLRQCLFIVTDTVHSGLEADQKVIAAHGCYAMAATTALTAQNTLGVSAIHHVPSDFVVKQMEMCMNDIGVDVVKIGRYCLACESSQSVISY